MVIRMSKHNVFSGNPNKGNGHDTILKAKRVYARINPVSLLLLRPRLKVMDIDNFKKGFDYF